MGAPADRRASARGDEAAVAGAVALAAARGPATRREARLQRFLAAAKDIASGGVGRIDVETD